MKNELKTFAELGNIFISPLILDRAKELCERTQQYAKAYLEQGQKSQHLKNQRISSLKLAKELLLQLYRHLSTDEQKQIERFVNMSISTIEFTIIRIEEGRE